MTSLDDELQELFRSAATPVDGQGGDIRTVRVAARRRQFRQRASVLAVAATFVVVAGFGLAAVGDDGGGSDVDLGGDGSTTTEQEPTTTTSTPSTTTTAAPPPAQPSIRDVDFASATFPAPCLAFDDQEMTLSGGQGRNPIPGGAFIDAWLDDVVYVDVDNDGDEEAVVLVGCQFDGAGVGNGLLAAVFEADADGQPQLLGEPLTLEHPYESSLDGATLTVRRDVYADTDPSCCPSSAVEEVWRFDGSAFERELTRDLPPRSMLRPPDSQTPAAGTCAEPTEAVVEVVINPDVPSPRCTRVGRSQQLQVRNATDQEVMVALGNFSATLPPGGTAVSERPFGDYLEPGVHRMFATLYNGSGPEIWLVG
jgi:hypothetical protein